jgi:hypothetical protein
MVGGLQGRGLSSYGDSPGKKKTRQRRGLPRVLGRAAREASLIDLGSRRNTFSTRIALARVALDPNRSRLAASRAGSHSFAIKVALRRGLLRL